MSKDHTGSIRGFHHYNAAWYSKRIPRLDRSIDHIMIGMYHTQGGTTGEFKVHWEELAGVEVAQLCVFDDAWHALAQFPDLLAEMAAIDKKHITPLEFCALLESMGIKDLTERIQK